MLLSAQGGDEQGNGRQTLQLDSVTGATMPSMAFTQGLEDCAKQADQPTYQKARPVLSTPSVNRSKVMKTPSDLLEKIDDSIFVKAPASIPAHVRQPGWQITVLYLTFLRVELRHF